MHTRILAHPIRTLLLAALSLSACGATAIPLTSQQTPSSRSWLAGDHHIHSRYSAGWDTTTTPPSPVIAGDARYPIPQNAEMALRHGLSWMVSTDHGGPNHSKVNLEMAYPELLGSRKSVPGLIQFYGMEFDTPGADHSSLIIPHGDHEHETLYEIESRFAKRDVFPTDRSRDTEPKMLEALEYMKTFETDPVLIANHPSRSAPGLGNYGNDDPAELRDWNDTAPRIAVGSEGSPGHQANAINRDGSLDPRGRRGGYGNHPTYGGFDQMAGRLGGFWDSMLGEGRRWWITASSDSHANWRDGGSDFWPGEYSKTYVHAANDYDDVLEGIRSGRVFVTLGDLISELDFTAKVQGSSAAAAMIGGALQVPANAEVDVVMRIRDPQGVNHHGDRREVARVDLILGEIAGPVADRMQDTNTTTRVIRRFTSADWTRDGEYLTMRMTLQDVHHSSYIRLRGTSGQEIEPQVDPLGEDPWSDLWFYSNPIFLEVQ